MDDESTPGAFKTTDPSTLAPGKSYPGHSAAQAAAKVTRAAEAQRGWRRTGFDERARLMRAAGGVLRRRRDEFAALMTDEMGKTVTDGRAEIEKCASDCEHFAEHAGDLPGAPGRRPRRPDARSSPSTRSASSSP